MIGPSEEQKKMEMFFSALPLLVFLLLPGVSATPEGLWEDNKYGRHSSEVLHPEHNCSWTCMLFTLQWPGGFCQSLYKKTQCRIPQNISSWTIHGLWPLHAQRCCSCWPMFLSDVQELEEELEEYWPSLLKTKPCFHFWKEEWIKHGSCAACVEGFNSPLKYFQICLKLRHQFDIYGLLRDAGITPSCERLYKVAEVQKVLLPHVGDKHEIQCVKDEQDRQVLFQVKVRLSRNLTIGCDHHGDTNGGPAAGPSPAAGPGPGQPPSPGHPCPPDAPFFYFPINHEEPWRPCG
ncbi:ribonuclease T2-like [Fundulus diaphanus]